MGANSQADMSRNAGYMSNGDLTKAADAVFSVQTTNPRNQAAQQVLVKEMAARGINPAQYGYTGPPVTVNPNPKADPTVTAQNKAQAAQAKAAQAQATAQKQAVAAQTKAAAQAQAAQAKAAAQAKTQATQQAAQAKAQRLAQAKDAAAQALIDRTATDRQLNADWRQVIGRRARKGQNNSPVKQQSTGKYLPNG